VSDDLKTVTDVLQAGRAYLERHGVPEPQMACELLLSCLLRCPRLELPARAKQSLLERHLDAMRRGLKRVAAGEPVQYVLGEWDFMGYTLKLDPRALIPRPETECLVETVLRCEPLWQRRQPAIVDVGTGTGCIVISLARRHPEALYMASDISAGALELARENARALGVAERIAFVQASDLAEFLEPEMIDAVVSNPPYVRTEDFEKLPPHIRHHEPRVALDGGPDGLGVTTTIIADASLALKPGGYIFLEIASDQAPAVTLKLEQAGFTGVSVTKDLAGRDRVVSAVLA